MGATKMITNECPQIKKVLVPKPTLNTVKGKKIKKNTTVLSDINDDDKQSDKSSIVTSSSTEIPLENDDKDIAIIRMHPIKNSCAFTSTSKNKDTKKTNAEETCERRSDQDGNSPMILQGQKVPRVAILESGEEHVSLPKRNESVTEENTHQFDMKTSDNLSESTKRVADDGVKQNHSHRHSKLNVSRQKIAQLGSITESSVSKQIFFQTSAKLCSTSPVPRSQTKDHHHQDTDKLLAIVVENVPGEVKISHADTRQWTASTSQVAEPAKSESLENKSTVTSHIANVKDCDTSHNLTSHTSVPSYRNCADIHSDYNITLSQNNKMSNVDVAVKQSPSSKCDFDDHGDSQRGKKVLPKLGVPANIVNTQVCCEIGPCSRLHIVKSMKTQGGIISPHSEAVHSSYHERGKLAVDNEPKSNVVPKYNDVTGFTNPCDGVIVSEVCQAEYDDMMTDKNDIDKFPVERNLYSKLSKVTLLHCNGGTDSDKDIDKGVLVIDKETDLDELVMDKETNTSELIIVQEINTGKLIMDKETNTGKELMDKETNTGELLMNIETETGELIMEKANYAEEHNSNDTETHCLQENSKKSSKLNVSITELHCCSENSTNASENSENNDTQEQVENPITNIPPVKTGPNRTETTNDVSAASKALETFGTVSDAESKDSEDGYAVLVDFHDSEMINRYIDDLKTTLIKTDSALRFRCQEAGTQDTWWTNDLKLVEEVSHAVKTLVGLLSAYLDLTNTGVRTSANVDKYFELCNWMQENFVPLSISMQELLNNGTAFPEPSYYIKISDLLGCFTSWTKGLTELFYTVTTPDSEQPTARYNNNLTMQQFGNTEQIVYFDRDVMDVTDQYDEANEIEELYFANVLMNYNKSNDDELVGFTNTMGEFHRLNAHVNGEGQGHVANLYPILNVDNIPNIWNYNAENPVSVDARFHVPYANYSTKDEHPGGGAISTPEYPMDTSGDSWSPANQVQYDYDSSTPEQLQNCRHYNPHPIAVDPNHTMDTSYSSSREPSDQNTYSWQDYHHAGHNYQFHVGQHSYESASSAHFFPNGITSTYGGRHGIDDYASSGSSMDDANVRYANHYHQAQAYRQFQQAFPGYVQHQDTDTTSTSSNQRYAESTPTTNEGSEYQTESFFPQTLYEFLNAAEHQSGRC